MLNRHRRRKRLEREVRQAQEKLQEVHEQQPKVDSAAKALWWHVEQNNFTPRIARQFKERS